MEGDKNFHTLTADEALKTLDSQTNGLSDEESARRLQEFGPNKFALAKPVSPIKIFLSQFKSPLIIVLLVATMLIFFVWLIERDRSDLIEGTLILIIIIFITLLGFIQEFRAEKVMEALKNLLAAQCKVLRDGQVRLISTERLVPGDIVLIEEGEKIPADLRLLEIAELSVNEATLTGESVDVKKDAGHLAQEKSSLSERKNMAFSGTIVTRGRGKGIVCQTGNQTEIGAIAKEVAEAPAKPTPIQLRLSRIGKVLGYGVSVVAVIVFIFIMLFPGELADLPTIGRLVRAFVAAIALAVAAVPEGLPAVVTITLALGATRMLSQKALMRKLSSVETLGSTDVICADKTGTLTKGEMTATEYNLSGWTVKVTGSGYEERGEFLSDNKKTPVNETLKLALTIGELCNNAERDRLRWLGDPTEIALKVASRKAQLTLEAPRKKEIPFSSERKMMSVIVEGKNSLTMYVKGAPEVIVEKSNQLFKDGRVQPLNASEKKKILQAVEQMSERALRTLALAYRPVKNAEDYKEEGLIFVGLVGMIDPPRAAVPKLIKTTQEAGFQIIMITGDHEATARAIGQAIGLGDRVITGGELEKMERSELLSKIRQVNIFARVNPSSKMKIVEALKFRGHIVAMTGDGVNDAPAIKRADIGIAMGKTGTDVAKEASDMVLLDDRFETIIEAVKEGRGIFQNIRKFVNYLLSCNIAEVLIVFLGIIIFNDLPLTAIMLLWINLVTDGLPAVAIGLDRPAKDILNQRPKEFQEEIVTKRLWLEMAIIGLVLALLVLGIYAVNLSEGASEARGAAFTAIVILELARIFVIRQDYRIGAFSNGYLLGAVGLSLALQLAIIYLDWAAELFGIGAIDARDWLLIAGAAVIIWVTHLLVRQKPSLTQNTAAMLR